VTATVPSPGSSIEARSAPAIRFANQSGCWLPPPEATTRRASASSEPSANHATGVSRSSPLRRPVVCRISTSMPMNEPLPFRILRFIRAFMRCCIHRENDPGVPGLRPVSPPPACWFCVSESCMRQS
jgi:hypothetical protein